MPAPDATFAAATRLARVLVLAFALQVSGVPHVAIDLVVADGSCADPCDDDDTGQCPPLCSDCACAHGVRPAIDTASELVLELPAAREATVPTFLARAPDEPDTTEIFLPPRS